MRYKSGLYMVIHRTFGILPSRRKGFQPLHHLEQQLRFAVHRPGYPVASPRSHGVPRRDVPSRVHVSVAGETTGCADEARLALARLRIHVPARRAALAAKRRIDLLYTTEGLVFQSANQQSPARGENAPVQPGLLPYVSARCLKSSPSRTCHVLDLQSLHPDEVELPGQLRAGLLNPVLAPVALAGFQACNAKPHAHPAVRACPSAGKLAFQTTQSFPLPLGQSRHASQFPCRKGRSNNHAAIDADDLAVTGCRNRLGDGDESHMPASRPVHGHPIRLHARRHRTRPAKPHPSDFRDAHLAYVTGQSAHIPLLSASPYDRKPFVPPGLAPRWLTGRIGRAEECGHCLSEIAEGLLLDCLGACGQPRMLGAGGGELPTLLKVAGGVLAAWAPVPMLLDSQVPHIPGMRAVVPKHCFLGSGGTQTVPVHTNTLATTSDISRR